MTGPMITGFTFHYQSTVFFFLSLPKVTWVDLIFLVRIFSYTLSTILNFQISLKMRDSLDWISISVLLLLSSYYSPHRRRCGPTMWPDVRPTSVSAQAMVSIQSAVYRREENFGTKFRSRFSGIFTTGPTPGTGLKRSGALARVD